MADLFVALDILYNMENPAEPVVNIPDGPNVLWFRATDAEGVIVEIDRDFNLVWHGDEDRARQRLRKILRLDPGLVGDRTLH